MTVFGVGGLRERGRRHAGRPDRLRRGERHRRSRSSAARDFEEQINSQVLGGNPPDIAIFPQPGKLRQLRRRRRRVPVARRRAGHGRRRTGTRAGWLLATSTARSTACRSSPTSSRSSGTARRRSRRRATRSPRRSTTSSRSTDEMIANGDTPLCVGIESGPATGWPFTDWTEEIDPAQRGHRLLQPVGRPRGAVQRPAGRRGDAARSPTCGPTEDGCVYAAGGSIAATPFGDNAQPLVDGDCMMHRQANFFAAFFPEGTEFGDGPGHRHVLLPVRRGRRRCWSAGTSAAAFRDAPEVWAVMDYYGSPEYANNRQARPAARRAPSRRDVISGFLSAATDADPAYYSALEQGFLEVLATGRAGRLRRLRPDARRGRLGHVLAEAHGARERRQGRPGGGRHHRGLLAELTSSSAASRSTDGAGDPHEGHRHRRRFSR